jgi:hypothetical protein
VEYTEGTKEQVIENVKEISPETGQIPEKNIKRKQAMT